MIKSISPTTWMHLKSGFLSPLAHICEKKSFFPFQTIFHQKKTINVFTTEFFFIFKKFFRLTLCLNFELLWLFDCFWNFHRSFFSGIVSQLTKNYSFNNNSPAHSDSFMRFVQFLYISTFRLFLAEHPNSVEVHAKLSNKVITNIDLYFWKEHINIVQTKNLSLSGNFEENVQ